MAQVLRRLDLSTGPDVLVGAGTLDDAAVVRRPDGMALVATVDFFTPIVDDARTWGEIAAANAVSDVYAMGARPLFALNIAGWPRDRIPIDVLGDVLAGGIDKAREGGWFVVGGHTTDSPEPHYGQAVIGEVAEDAVLTNAGGRPGQALVLTKAIGTGILATAVKAGEAGDTESGGSLHASYEAGVASMTRLNDDAARVARDAGAGGCTDVTGFGLLGHLHQFARASGVTASVAAETVPVLPDVWDLLDAGHVPGGTRRNVAYAREHLVDDADDRVLTMLSDAQTSGGLVFSCAPDAAEDAVETLTASGHAAAVIGSLHDGEPGTLRVH